MDRNNILYTDEKRMYYTNRKDKYSKNNITYTIIINRKMSLFGGASRQTKEESWMESHGRNFKSF